MSLPVVIAAAATRAALTCALAGLTTAATATASAAPAAGPKTTVSVQVVATLALSNLGRVQHEIDRCRGPVAAGFNTGTGTRHLLARHNYCGGGAWLTLRVGDTVKVSGLGAKSGTYRVNGATTMNPGTHSMWDLPKTPLVLQTCLGGSKVSRFVALAKTRR